MSFTVCEIPEPGASRVPMLWLRRGVGRYWVVTPEDLRREDFEAHATERLTAGPMIHGVGFHPTGEVQYVAYTYFKKGTSPLLHVAAVSPIGVVRPLVTTRRWLRQRWHELVGERLPRAAISPYETVRLAIRVDIITQDRKTILSKENTNNDY